MAKWYSAGISNPSRDEGMGSNPGAVQKKITGRHLGVMTWVWPGPLRVSEVQGRNTCFSEDSLLSSSPMSFYLLYRFSLPVTVGRKLWLCFLIGHLCKFSLISVYDLISRKELELDRSRFQLSNNYLLLS